jgi:DNA-binding NtrC family response regulator
MQATILVADDEGPIRESLADVMREDGFTVYTAADGLQALQALREHAIDVALIDIRMPGKTGMQVLAEAQRAAIDTQIIMITAFGTVDNAVEAMRLGARDYVTKPFVFDDIFIKIERLLDMRRLQAENTFLHAELAGRYSFEGIVGRSGAVQEVLGIIRRLAQTRTGALITGESGTGKELVARAIHYSGITRAGRFVAVNCAALPDTLVESELFGHTRGAFSGAEREKPGQFELADGGTIFLDEISTMPLNIQPKLLRAIEQKRVQRVGATQAVDVDVRILCATNRRLKTEVEEGRFREDLYYRLNVVEIHLPPLRERPDDIPLLIGHFVEKFNRELGKCCPGVTDAAMRAMMAYGWPGNVRELENVIERGIIFVDDEPIDVGDLPFDTGSPRLVAAGESDLKAIVRAFEREHILQVLRRCDFDKSTAARALNIGLSSLYRKIAELDIETHVGTDAPSDN